MMRWKWIEQKRGRKRAAAVVEFAVVAPLLFLLLFGIIEYGFIFLARQTMIQAAREGCRIAVLQQTTDPYSEVTARMDEVLTAAGVTGYVISMTHATPADPMETIQVTVPMSEVSLMGNMFHSGDEILEASCSMRKEGMGVVTE